MQALSIGQQGPAGLLHLFEVLWLETSQKLTWLREKQGP